MKVTIASFLKITFFFLVIGVLLEDAVVVYTFEIVVGHYLVDTY